MLQADETGTGIGGGPHTSKSTEVGQSNVSGRRGARGERRQAREGQLSWGHIRRSLDCQAKIWTSPRTQQGTNEER